MQENHGDESGEPEPDVAAIVDQEPNENPDDSDYEGDSETSQHSASDESDDDMEPAGHEPHDNEDNASDMSLADAPRVNPGDGDAMADTNQESESSPGSQDEKGAVPDELTPTEKRKLFWAKYAVKRNFHNPMCEGGAPSGKGECDDDDDISLTPTLSPGSPWEPDAYSSRGRAVFTNVKRVDGDAVIPHAKSDDESCDSGSTWVLGQQPRSPSPMAEPEPREAPNPKAEAYTGSGSEDDSYDSSSSEKGVVDEDTFHQELRKASVAAQDRAINSGPSSGSKATMETPQCSKPGFWGFPLVETPPKVSVFQLCSEKCCNLILSCFWWFGFHYNSIVCSLLITPSSMKAAHTLNSHKMSSLFSKAPHKNKGNKGNKGKKKCTHKVNKKASFKRSGTSKKVAKADEHSVDSLSMAPMSPEPKSTYGAYSLDEIPRDAWPNLSRANRGNHSYTLSDGNGAVVEVLLQKRGFFIKKVKDGFEGPQGHVSWGKFENVQKAWDVVRSRSGYRLNP